MPASDLDPRLLPLAEGLTSRPAVGEVTDGHLDDEGYWWLRFRVDTGAAEVWDELQRLAWLFNNIYLAEPESVLLRPLASAPQPSAAPGADLHWSLECLAPEYTPDRALDMLLTPVGQSRMTMAGRAG